MRRIQNIAALILLVVTLGGCRSEVDIASLVDRNSSLTISTREINPATGLSSSEEEIIKFDSEMFSRLMEFAENNQKGWQINHKVYLGTIQVRQDDFKLIYESGYNGVVVSYMDSLNKWEQYSKKINDGELDFLTDPSVSTSTGPTITISGIAENAKWGAIITSDSKMYYIDGMDAWDDDTVGRAVRVTGNLSTKSHKAEDLQNEKGEWNQGMVGEQKTLLKASWKIVVK